MAPSPTGPIHIGNVHTTMFNWLFARQRGGRFVLRFEDTDAARSDRRWEQIIYDELRWLGLDWDEAPDLGGPYGPYRQTERLGLYRRYAQLLIEAGAAYECYCTAQELDAERAAQDEGHRPYRYSRRCRRLAPEERRAFLEDGRTPAIRFAVPDDQVVVVEDLIRGPIEFQTSVLGDPVIVRRNGMPLYNFAVVVDDLTMRVTHVLRGEGHVSNTPLQVLIYRALGESAPVFGHFGHITGGHGAKFSKRRGEGYIGYYREQGILPEAMFNYLALLGWTPSGEREILTRDEILKEFDINRVTPSPSQFDPVKLRWFSGHHIRRLQTAELAERCLPYLVQAGLLPEAPGAEEMARVEGVVALAQTRIETLGEIVELTEYFFRDELSYTPQAEKMIARPGVREMLELALKRLSAAPEWTVGSLESAGAQLLADLDRKPAAVYQPIRAAVTGRTASPPLFDTLYWIGRERSLSRLARAAGGDIAAPALPGPRGTSPTKV